MSRGDRRPSALPSRFLVGVAPAGVYAPGVRLVATHYERRRGVLDVGAAVRALRDRPVRLTTLGSLGHMWELYAFWAWLPAFSAAVTELAEPRYAGSALTLQLALGFALTVASIRLVPLTGGAIGWRYALVPLAIGPVAGTFAMLRLRTLPAARRLADGRR